MAGNSNNSKIPAEHCAKLYIIKIFFWSSREFRGKIQNLFQKNALNLEQSFHQIAAALQMRLVSTTNVSPHAIFYSLNAGYSYRTATS